MYLIITINYHVIAILFKKYSLNQKGSLVHKVSPNGEGPKKVWQK